MSVRIHLGVISNCVIILLQLVPCKSPIVKCFEMPSIDLQSPCVVISSFPVHSKLPVRKSPIVVEICIGRFQCCRLRKVFDRSVEVALAIIAYAPARESAHVSLGSVFDTISLTSRLSAHKHFSMALSDGRHTSEQWAYALLDYPCKGIQGII